MVDTPGKSFPVIGDALVLRVKLSLLIATFAVATSGVAGGAVWMTSVNDRLSRIEDFLGIDQHARRSDSQPGRYPSDTQK